MCAHVFETSLRCRSPGTTALLFKTGSLIGLELMEKAKLAGWKAPRILWDYKNNPTMACSLLHGF